MEKKKQEPDQREGEPWVESKIRLSSSSYYQHQPKVGRRRKTTHSGLPDRRSKKKKRPNDRHAIPELISVRMHIVQPSVGRTFPLLLLWSSTITRASEGQVTLGVVFIRLRRAYHKDKPPRGNRILDPRRVRPFDRRSHTKNQDVHKSPTEGWRT